MEGQALEMLGRRISRAAKGGRQLARPFQRQPDPTIGRCDNLGIPSGMHLRGATDVAMPKNKFLFLLHILDLATCALF